jgi:ABC-type multidrug transport system permease subunit
MGNTEQVRNVGFACSATMIVCGNQMYGDMGIFSLRTMYLLATTYAVALRLPIVGGVWQAPPRAASTPLPPAARVVEGNPGAQG